MAKDNLEGKGIQYKVLIRPTVIGLLVMKRLNRPHVDMSAELRRLIELGYAAEQSGFILDETTLRHAGRIWDVQPVLSVQSSTSNGYGQQTTSVPNNEGHEKQSKPEVLSSSPSITASSAITSNPELEPAGLSVVNEGSTLMNNLRRLSS